MGLARTAGESILQLSASMRRAKTALLSVAVAYVLSLGLGIVMVHSGSPFALTFRDRLVTQAHKTSPILQAFNKGRKATAAALDFAANLGGGGATLLAGYWAPGVYPIVIYRGWIGGIVSIDGRHHSRLATGPEAAYYLLVLILQLLPHTLAAGAGVNLGLARVRATGAYAGAKFLGIPRLAWWDAARIYGLAIPLFMIASSFEFFLVPG
jgi:hypothetical protein